jgi:hypothetical protein
MALPPELSRLGEHLEDAARRTVLRRRRRRAVATALTGAAAAWGCLTLSPAVTQDAQRAAVALEESSEYVLALPTCAEIPGIRRGPCITQVARTAPPHRTWKRFGGPSMRY